MIKPHGSDELKPLFVADDAARAALLAEAEALPQLVLNSAAAANAVMLGAGYFTPLSGYMNLADTLSVAESLTTANGLFFPVPVLNRTDNVDGIEVGARASLCARMAASRAARSAVCALSSRLSALNAPIHSHRPISAAAPTANRAASGESPNMALRPHASAAPPQPSSALTPSAPEKSVSSSSSRPEPQSRDSRAPLRPRG